MFHKRATFSLTLEHVLNEPVLPDFMVRQDTGFDKNNLANTIESIKVAHKVIDSDGKDFDLEAEIKKYPDSLYVKCFAIKADEPNDNGDYFSRSELIKATPTFVGVPIFTNHANQDINQARGKVVHSWWDDSRNGIMIIARVDSHAYPQLARSIKQDYVTSTSMGCAVHHSLCSICHNYAENPSEYCTHIANTKTRTVSAKKVKCTYHKHGKEEECPICGSKKNDSKTFDVEKKAFEYNYGIKFIENSFVVNPACHECGVVEVIDPTKLRARITQIADRLPSLIKAAQQEHFCSDAGCFKVAGQDQLNRLNQAIELLSSVSADMLKQKDQIDLEFLTDLVKVLADLQAVTDELNQQGYGRLPSPTDSAAQPAASTPTESTQPQQTPTTPVNPTPGGGSKIHSGPAGGAGTFTGPLASKTIKLEKIGSIINKSKEIMINVNLMKGKAIKPNLKIVNNSKSIF